ncbi:MULTISPECIES: hypothetical protein [Rhodococcus]|uniref:hypothetical protein n=1 Tax=Rhodococcus TaxID=1827 RepID=UPI0011AB5B07|nr:MULTISPECIES: hypothetical protein [Rhodococcus]
MSNIHAPRDVKSTGIGRHRLVFVDGVCRDPGLNAGERAHLLGLGYRFDDERPSAPDMAFWTDKTAAPAEPVVEPEAEPEPVSEPVKPKRTHTRKPTPKAEPATTADADE